MATRKLSAEQVATTRLILHLVGIVGAAAAGEDWAKKARTLLNPAHVAERPGHGVIDIFWSGARADSDTIGRLAGRTFERMALGVHLVLANGAMEDGVTTSWGWGGT